MAGFDEIVALRHTNVSTPQLEHSSSKQSVAADEYYSAREGSRPESAESDERPRSVNNPFSTPPTSRPGSAQRRRSSQAIALSPTVAERVQAIQSQRDGVDEGSSESPTVRLVGSNNNIPRKPVGSSPRPRAVSQMSDDSSPPTPGHDDSPYILFAIDQLTRDEEVRGSRRYAYPSGVPAQAEIRQGPYVPPKRTTPAYGDEDDRQRLTEASQVPADDTREPEVLSEKQYEEEIAPVHPIGEDPLRSPRDSAREYLAANHPLRTSSLPDQAPPELGLYPNVFVPYEQEIPALKFRPSILRLPAMLAYLTLCGLMIAGLIFSGVWSGTHDGLYGYSRFGGARYFIFEYLPAMLGVFLHLWLLQIQIAIQRIAPFTAMASMSTRSRTEAPLMPVHPTNFLLPNLHYFRARLTLVGVVMFVFWLQIFTVPLLTCVYNVYFYGTSPNGSWRWTAVQGVIWTTLVLFVLQFVAILALMVWLRNQRTGMLWDYRSLADYVTLLDHSNCLRKYTDTETFPNAKQFRNHFAHDTDRLGYWHTSNRPTEAFYGLGEEGAAIRRYSIERGRLREKSPVEHSSFPSDTPTTAVNDRDSIDLESSDEFQRVRYHYLPWIIRPSAVLLWSITAILLYVAFIIASYINNAVLNGFAPLTKVSPTSAGFSATNFTYSFIPALIAQFCFLAWLSIDFAFRRLQPYANMSRSGTTPGAKAADSILLDYPARLPGSVTMTALVGKDFRIAWYTFVTLLAASLPILAGGCFWAQFYVNTQQVRVAVDPSAYYTLCVFLALYAFTLPTALIGLRKCRLPHPVTTLAEQISFLYQSDFLSDKGSQNRSPLGSKAQLTTRMMRPTPQLSYGIERITSGGDHRFLFGRFVGRDNKIHLGVHSNAARREYNFEAERWSPPPPLPQMPEQARVSKPVPRTPGFGEVGREPHPTELQPQVDERPLSQRLDERVRNAGLGRTKEV